MNKQMTIRLWCILMCILMLIPCCIISVPVYASETDDYKTFSQKDERWGDYEYDSGCTIKQYGCMITGISILMAYANPDLRDVETFNPAIASKSMSFLNGGIYWYSVSGVDNTFSLKDNVKEYSGSALSESDAKERIVSLYNRGYYILVCTYGLYSNSTHYSPIVGVEGGTPLIWDVANSNNSNWQTWGNNGITEIIAFKSTIQNSNVAMANNTVSSVAAATPQTAEAKEKENAIVESLNLVGMEGYITGILTENQKEIQLKSKSNLSQRERARLDAIGNAIKVSKKSFPSMVNSIISLIGLLCVVYAVLLFLVAVFDYVNTFIEISLLSILTFGKLKLTPRELLLDSAMDRKKYVKDGYVSMQICILRICVLLAVGVFILSGGIQASLYSVYEWFRTR